MMYTVYLISGSSLFPYRVFFVVLSPESLRYILIHNLQSNQRF